MPTPKSAKSAPKPWSVSLVTLGGEQHAEGDTCLEALSGLVRPDKITTKGVLTVAHGENSKSLTMTVRDLKRLFYPISLPHHAKKLQHGL